MASKYEMWLSHDGESDKMFFPVLPDSINFKRGSMNKSVTVSGLGEIVIKQDRPALTIDFSSFFPAKPFPGVQVTELTGPRKLVNKIVKWQYSDKPVHFVITKTLINKYFTIENFSFSEQGGDVGTVHYSLSLKEYRDVSVDKKATVDESTKTATLPADTPTRTDNRVSPKTYTVLSGDTLSKIAANLLGAGSRYVEIVKLNSDIIKNPNLIHPGQVFKLPE